MESIKKFYDLLFDDNDKICWGIDCFSTHIYGKWQWEYDLNKFCLFSINPLIDSRKDSNVTCFRNILLEFDNISSDKQNHIINNIPRSTVVWSGNKSYHAIISLEQPCKDRVEYDALVRRIYEKLPEADRSAKNPSRFSRAPGAIRNNGNKQTLEYVGQKITRQELEAWLGPAPELKQSNAVGSIIEISGRKRILMPTTNFFLMQGASPGFWNLSLFNAACDMVRAGYNKEEIKQRMTEITGHLDKHDLRTIQSAWDTVHRG